MNRAILRLFPLTLAAAGCASVGNMVSRYDVSKQTVQSMEVSGTKIRPDAAFGAVTSTLVERGFDIKVSNRDAGLVTTEYKKFASAGDSPPFDYYLQIKATIQTASNGQTLVRLSPAVRQQNRLNAAAFTDQELYYYEGTPEGVHAATKREDWVTAGQTLFMNAVSDVAGLVGAAAADVKKNVTTTTKNTLMD